MDKKSYLRGFGTGVLFTAIILGIVCMIKTSDYSVKKRAVELGMVEGNYDEWPKSTVVSDDAIIVTPEDSTKDLDSDDTDSSKSTKTPQKTDKTDVSAAKTNSSDDADTSSGKNSNSDSSKKDSTDSEDLDKKYDNEKSKLSKDIEDAQKTLIINVGDWSEKISQELESMGVIDDANDFDKYMSDNGYANNIKTGTYKIDIDATYEEIANEISSK